MEEFATFLEAIEDPEHRRRSVEVLTWVQKTFPTLVPRFAWGQPMFTDHGTFIIGFSVAKPHLALAPEGGGIRHFSEAILKAGYTHGAKFMRIKWEQPVNYGLLEEIIRFNLEEKKACTTFWRQNDFCN
ncbi:iron chaperone [Sphaerochaeta sp. PS]|uniref:iron chaperone n=1 Tax=Sphaerochaeta sp. PS TaxID=3076336 RepID=UPI0028A538B2|nr:iron chaperone [Sphaerochaeta sp. PS]MDT4761351.1 iron chaperone [Sphaerochaeta sp. PS]